jgi:uncharacterized membrane protein YqaE (UPF0057 family)
MRKLCLLLSIILFALITYAAGVTAESTPGVASDSTTLPIMNDAVVDDALREFKSLSRVERKARLKEVKKTVREYKAARKAAAADAAEPSTNTLLLAILAILLPPLAVALHEGHINGKFWLSLLLTLLFWLPGVIYALIVVL